MRSFYFHRVAFEFRRLLLTLGGNVCLGVGNRPPWACSLGQEYRGHILTAFLPAGPAHEGGVWEQSYPWELWGKPRRGNRG